MPPSLPAYQPALPSSCSVSPVGYAVALPARAATPFRLRWQPVLHAFLFVERLDERRRVIPSDQVHRHVRPRKIIRMLLARHRLPLLARDLATAHVKRLRQPHAMRCRLRRTARAAHDELTRRDQAKFHPDRIAPFHWLAEFRRSRLLSSHGLFRGINNGQIIREHRPRQKCRGDRCDDLFPGVHRRSAAQGGCA